MTSIWGDGVVGVGYLDREGFPREVNLRREKRWVLCVVMGSKKPLGQEKPKALPWLAGSAPSSRLAQNLD